MHTSEVISTLHQRGITLKVVNGDLKGRGAEKLNDREKTALRAHRSAILRALTAPPTAPIATAGQTPPAATTVATVPLPARSDPPEPGTTTPFNKEALDAIKAGAGCWVWSGTLGAWLFVVRDEERRRKALARGIDPGGIWTLAEVTSVAGMPPEGLQHIAKLKQQFAGTVQPGEVPARWRGALGSLEPAVAKEVRA